MTLAGAVSRAAPWCALVAITFVIAAMPGQLPGQTSSALASVSAVRKLTAEEARQARPVRVNGTVTDLSGFKNSFFLQDSTAGISVDRTDSADVKVGDEVEVTGVSNAGAFAPVILASHVRVVGHGPLPPARKVKYSDTFGGREDSQRIEVEGVVHSARFSNLFGHDILLLNVELGGGEITAMLQNFVGIDANRLIDSTLRVRGVCSTSFNQKRQFVGLAMFVPDPGHIDVVQAANVDPFAIAATPLGNILQFGQAPHRVKVAGYVTYQIPGQALYLQDGRDGIRIQSSSTETITAGARVEAVGFPAAGDYAPVLKDGIFRNAGPASPIIPLRINTRDVIVNKGGFFQVPYDGQLVQVQGVIAETYVQRGQRVLIVRQNTDVFEATLPLPQAEASSLEADSLVLLTGICVVHTAADSDRNPLSFEILLRSSKDIQILEHASWFTPTHARWAVFVLVLLLLFLTGWLVAVRREHSLRLLTVTDPLTGLYNRRGFFMLAERQWQSALRSKESVLLFYIDVDCFKEINDAHGHQQGDLALLAVAGVLRECFRKTDIIARVGGDEFAVMATEDYANSRALLEGRLSKALRQNNEKRGGPLQLALSIGVLQCNNTMEALCIEDLVAQADELMYLEKRSHHFALAGSAEQTRSLAQGKPMTLSSS